MDTRLKTFSLCMSVSGFIKNNHFPDDYIDVFESEGKTLSAEEALDFLNQEKDKGHKVIPCSGECGNPCKHQNNGCTGFDYSGKGCPGRYDEAT